MAIGTDSTIDFFGTQDTVTVAGGTSAVAAGAYSASGDVVSGGWTNDDDAPEASITLTGTFATAPAVNERVVLFIRLMDVDGTADNPQPDANFAETRAGAFVLDNVTVSQTLTIDIDLPNAQTSQIYEFYIRNDTSNDSLNAGWTLKVTPKTLGPHA